MRISDWSSDVCSSDLYAYRCTCHRRRRPADCPDRSTDRGWHAIDGRRTASTGVGGRQFSRNPAQSAAHWTARNHHFRDRKSVVKGKSVSVRVHLGGCRIIKKKTKHVQQPILEP